MTRGEIERRKQRVNAAGKELRDARAALNAALDEYAQQEAEKAGIDYNETRVMVRGNGPFFVIGRDTRFDFEVHYKLAKVKKDGTPSQAGAGTPPAPLSDMQIVRY